MKNLKVPILIIVFTVIIILSMFFMFMYVQKNKKTKYPAKDYETKYIFEKKSNLDNFFEKNKL